ncbi:vascular endothelial growth factor receptor 1 [Lingula anatina]|uniref:Vascular endothelial growth factor receptor 1 n=1 Tax=Lingula anatina TaxID=7574 RepID=A0A1S3I1B9_LINAN|nr:vascular endothelial growth factor receptor 1 [Lingula anatina]|eukprot:XP_013391626.1 vascular endothelial growth factor receptor 1 [Lingula anatina]
MEFTTLKDVMKFGPSPRLSAVLRLSLSLIFFIPVSSGNNLLLPPKLDIGTTEVVFQSEKNFTLKCIGEAEMEWVYPSHSFKDFSIENRISIVHSTDSSGNVSELTVGPAKYYDTGEYTCRYKLSPDNKDESKVYVYVSDEINILLPHELHPDPVALFLVQNRPGIIPCRVSSPNATVILKDGDKIIGPTEAVTYDPREGFKVLFPNVFFAYKQLVCEASYAGNGPDTMSVLTFYSEAPTNPPTPVIQSNQTRHMTGKDIQLRCIVLTSVGSTGNTLEWIYPNMDERSSRIAQVSEQHTIENGAFQYTRLRNNLTISKAIPTDAGVYTCRVTTLINQLTADDTISIDVFDSAFANLRPEKSVVEADLNQDLVSLNVIVDAYPPPQIYWKKNGQTIGRRLPKYEPRQNEDKASLLIFGVRREDAGVYTAHAPVGGEEEATSVTLQVIETPETSILKQHTETFYKPGKDYILECAVQGFPVPEIVWWWAGCKSLGCPETAYMIANSSRNYRGITKESHRSFLSLNAVESGKFSCRASNKKGTSESTEIVIVSDAENGFEVVRSSEVHIEGDMLTVSCRAAKYWYSDLAVEQENGHPLLSDARRRVSNSSTKYSNEITVTIDSLSLDDTGVIKCVALNSSRIRHTVDADIIVLGLKAPVFTNPLAGVNTVEASGVYKLECKASGLPIPVITWFKDGKNFSSDLKRPGVKFSSENTKITIERVSRHDAGLYECRATNRAGSIISNLTLQVEGDPIPDGIIKRGGLLSAQQTGMIVGIVAAVLLLVIIILVICVMRRKKKQRKELPLLMDYLQDQPRHDFNPDIPIDEQTECLAYDPKWEFPKERLKLGMVIGQGAFGRVVKAEAMGINDTEGPTPVAIKMVKDCYDSSQIKSLISELKVMIHLGHHLNILNVLGAVTKNIRQGEFYVIMEFCTFGNLRSYLIQNRSRFVDTMNQLTLANEGYLEPVSITGPSSTGSAQNTLTGINSRDSVRGGASLTDPGAASVTAITETTGGTVAAENYSNMKKEAAADGEDSAQSIKKEPILTSKDLVCFAFQIARGMDYLHSKKAPEPIKWLALESLLDKIFTPKSDVWSFGVLLWEIFTMGSTPYPGLELNETFVDKLKAGYRMQRPPKASAEIYEWMLDCWHPEAEERPSAAELAERFGDLLQHDTKQYYLDLNNSYAAANDPYLKMNTNGYLSMQVDSDNPKCKELADDEENQVSMGSDGNHYVDNVRWKKPTSKAKDAKDASEMEPLTAASESPPRDSQLKDLKEDLMYENSGKGSAAVDVHQQQSPDVEEHPLISRKSKTKPAPPPKPPGLSPKSSPRTSPEKEVHKPQPRPRSSSPWLPRSGSSSPSGSSRNISSPTGDRSPLVSRQPEREISPPPKDYVSIFKNREKGSGGSNASSGFHEDIDSDIPLERAPRPPSQEPEFSNGLNESVA